MWTRSERLFRALAVLFVLGHPVLSLPASAQEPQETAAAPAAVDQETLRATLEERYEVLPIRDGVLLKPRSRNLSNLGVRSVEVSGATVGVNGERVDPNVLRAWLGEEAVPVLQLQALRPADRRALFGLSEAGAPAPAASEDHTPADVPGADDEADEMDTAGIPPAPPVPDAPDEDEGDEDDTSVQSGSQVNVGGGITVAKGEVAEEAVTVFGPVRIDGEVLRDAVSILGPVRIEGKVGGEVVAVMGSVTLGPNAEVMGDVTTVGGTIRRAPGAKIYGSTKEVALAPAIREGLRRGDPEISIFSNFDGPMELFWSISGTFLLGLLVCLVLLVARRPLERVDMRLAAEPWKAALAGLGAVFLSVPLVVVVSVLLVLTIVGCVLFLLYPFIALALALLALLGFAASAHRLGRWIEVRFGRNFGSPYAAALIGVFLIQIWSILGRLLGLGHGPADFLAFQFLLLGALVQLAAWIVGFGAVLLARFGAAPRPRPPVAMAPAMVPAGPVPPAPYPADPAAPPEPPVEPLTPAFPESWQEPPPAER
ncbi:MAG TPA: polymer-forming cytoskeletal protein [Thermoanaerobaculia bacterium]|nr:polymer-forming cytoskeletal protein [Thermoanaerobaculia bacterium]